MHTANRQFYTEKVTLSNSTKELQQISDALSNIHPSNMLPIIYHSLPSPSIRHINNKVEKLRANIALERVTSISTLVTGITAATFFHLKMCHYPLLENALLIMLLNHLTLIQFLPYLVKCLDFILPSLVIYSTLLLHLE